MEQEIENDVINFNSSMITADLSICLICSSSCSFSRDGFDKQIKLLQQFNILQLDNVEEQCICGDCSKLLEKIDQLQVEINSVVLSLKTIFHNSHPNSKNLNLVIHLLWLT